MAQSRPARLSPLRVRLLVFTAMVAVAVLAIYFIDRRAMTRMEQTQTHARTQAQTAILLNNHARTP